MKKIYTAIVVISLILSGFAIQLPTVAEGATDVLNDVSLGDSLVSYWELEEANATRTDSYGTNHLTDVGAGIPAVSAIQGNGADMEDDDGDILEIRDADQTGLDLGVGGTDFSISLWINAESLSTSDQIPIVKKLGEASANRGFRWIYNKSSNSFFVFISSNGSSETNKSVSYTLNTATDYHLVLVYDASEGTVDLYVNGSAQTQMTGFPTSIFNNNGTFAIGELEYSGENFDGVFDDVGVWNKALTSDNVTALNNSGGGLPFNAGGGGSETPTTPYMKVYNNIRFSGNLNFGI